MFIFFIVINLIALAMYSMYWATTGFSFSLAIPFIALFLSLMYFIQLARLDINVKVIKRKMKDFQEDLNALKNTKKKG